MIASLHTETEDVCNVYEYISLPDGGDNAYEEVSHAYMMGGQPQRRPKLEPPRLTHYDPLHLKRDDPGVQPSGRAAVVRQWLCKYSLLVGLVLMGVVAGLAVSLGYVIFIREGRLLCII